MYTDDVLISVVLQFIVPFNATCLQGVRTAAVIPKPSTKTEEMVNQGILATILSSYMTMAKPVTQQNTPAFVKRWTAALAAVGVVDLVSPTSWSGIVSLAKRFQNIIHGRPDLRAEIVDRLLQVTHIGLSGAVINQIKLVWDFSSLKAIQYMDVFINSYCRALEVPAVLKQALDLRTHWRAALLEDPLLMYCRVRDPGCHPELNHARYPDLYYAAISYAKAHKRIGENFQMSAAHVSSYAALIDKYIKKSATAELGEPSEEVKRGLAQLGYPTTTRRRRDSDTDSSSDEDNRRKRHRRH